ncbi:MAG: glucosamine-6-phosphate deaminase [Ruminococcaceae bacterium]|jgi:glucosamine-6-phosphate deaminase|nr:glucosamine-6-phosphate deaminase [Oscillospiraceae bacterium]
MNIRVFENDRQAAQAAACMIAAQILSKPAAVIGLATGGTPVPAYQELVRLTNAGVLDWSRVTTFNLDEYLGLPGDHDQSFKYFMMKHLFNKVNIAPESIHIPDGMAADPTEACMSYERAIREQGGIDLQLLGIGRNGHIGFNEPADAFSPITHVVDLTEDTIEANARFFASSADVPRQALSMGVGTIMQARSIVMLVTGTEKARAVRSMICEPVSPSCPASVLQLHANVTILLDSPAATAMNHCR